MTKSFQHPGHGNGEGKPRIEVPPADEATKPNAHATATNLAERKRRGRPFEPGNRAAEGRRPKLALLGVPAAATDPRYALSLRRASRYRKRRCSELAAAHGYVSAGASSLIASAALALSASRFLYEVAAETGDAETLKRASALANDARQNELAAWELAARESASKPSHTDPLVSIRARLGVKPEGKS